MKTSNESPKLPEDVKSSEVKDGRRRFLGAGSAITPVILTMVSQPALGVTCFTPSRSLSKNTSLSQKDKYGECTGAQSPGNYSQKTTDGSPAYSWPISPSTPFHPIFFEGSRPGTRLFATENGITRSMTMMEVLNLGPSQDPAKMAFHLIGAYLNCIGGNGAKIYLGSEVIPATLILSIWQEWAINGSYSPTANVFWSADQIKAYLKNNGIIA